MRGWAVHLSLMAVACVPEAPPPLGQAVIIVDTDLAVPSLANRLRVDLYTADGTRWYESREIGGVDPGDWPVSFSVYDPDPAAPRWMLVRLRVYPQGIVRDYHGERFAGRPEGGNPGDLAPVTPPPDGEAPRLLDARGADRTPTTEPEPLVTVDRLLLLRLVPGKRGSVRVVLRGRCAGTMANLAELSSCIDEENIRTRAAEYTLDPDSSRTTKSVQGTFAPTSPCIADLRPASTASDGTPLFDDEACVPGGSFLFGNVDTQGRDVYSDAPVRLAVLAPFRIDRYEVTVGRWRAALARRFVTPDGTPGGNEAPLAAGFPQECTWSVSSQKRETLPVTCVTRDAARAFCKFLGGDLPTEAQLEYVAQDVGRPVRTVYPWGDDPPDCNRAGFGREHSKTLDTTACLEGPMYAGWGPQPVDRFAGANGDVALGTGVVGLAGNAAELALDSFHSFLSVCWAKNGLDSPVCDEPSPSFVSNRGASWAHNVIALRNGWRATAPTQFISALGGFRCVRAVP